MFAKLPHDVAMGRVCENLDPRQFNKAAAVDGFTSSILSAGGNAQLTEPPIRQQAMGNAGNKS